MQNIQFTHKVSKGSRFNQIYIPKEMEANFEVGDFVEVKLLKKKEKIYYSENLEKLSDFKEKLIKEIFLKLNEFNEVQQVFVVGSFLTQKIDYNDVDLMIVLHKKDENAERKIYDKLTEKLNIKFHIIPISEDELHYLEKTCPLTKSMLYYYVSNKEFDISTKKIVDKNHIKFLLMMPEDLLEIKTNSKVFYDNLRRLITIERFLGDKNLDPKKVNNELNLIINKIGGNAGAILKNSEQIDDKIINKLREMIRKKLKNIKKNLNKK